MSLSEIEKLRIYEGNRPARLADFFDVTGDPSDQCMEWVGDLASVHWIGAKMKAGTLRVSGSVGRHVGSEMRGGEIHVEGNAGDWVGAEMHGGLIRIYGSAGHLLGAAYRGSAKGMTRGTILIRGDVGHEVGQSMRRGTIVVGGDAGDLAGFNMLAGTLLVLGQSGIRTGAGMRRGTIAILGPQRPKLLPSFHYACRVRPLALQLLLRQVMTQGMSIADGYLNMDVDMYNGDMIEGGRGELLLRA